MTTTKTIILSSILFASTAFSCQTSRQGVKNNTEKTDTIVFSKTNAAAAIEIQGIKGQSFNHPSFVIWMEDLDGNYLETIVITKSYASGKYGHAQLSDSTWSDKPGTSYQPAALPYWTHKKGLIDGTTLVPTPEHPYVDAHTAATPLNNFVVQSNVSKKQQAFRVLFEVNQTWDWNSYWTNNKFPDDLFYSHSAQPSLIYSVTVSPESSEKTYHLNPIGHGHPSGATGELFTDISTLSTAKHIFKSVTIKY